MVAQGSRIVPHSEVSAPVFAFTNTAVSSVPSMPSQFWSIWSPAGSSAPGLIDASWSSQSDNSLNPSPSRSSGGAVVVVVVVLDVDVVDGAGPVGVVQATASAATPIRRTGRARRKVHITIPPQRRTRASRHEPSHE